VRPFSAPKNEVKSLGLKERMKQSHAVEGQSNLRVNEEEQIVDINTQM
jgi:hypothetical protein